MTNKNDSIHFVETSRYIDNFKVSASVGLTKREYFVGLAMQNLQNVLLRKSGDETLKNYMLNLKTTSPESTIAKLACLQADALILELNNG